MADVNLIYSVIRSFTFCLRKDKNKREVGRMEQVGCWL